MKYIILDSAQEARERSREEAIKQGCGRNPQDVTRFWFDVIEHPSTKKGALAIPDQQEESKLDSIERGKLKPAAELQAAGWFKDQTQKDKDTNPQIGTLAIETEPETQGQWAWILGQFQLKPATTSAGDVKRSVVWLVAVLLLIAAIAITGKAFGMW